MSQIKPFVACFYCRNAETFNYISPCNECQCMSPGAQLPSAFETKVEPGKSAAVGQSDPNGTDQHEAGAKLDAGKNRWSLLPWKIIEGIVRVMTFGADKYTEDGWKEVPQAKERYFSALMRHKMLMDAGEYRDPESGLPHWAHFCCNAVFLGYFYLKDAPK